MGAFYRTHARHGKENRRCTLNLVDFLRPTHNTSLILNARALWPPGRGAFCVRGCSGDALGVSSRRSNSLRAAFPGTASFAKVSTGFGGAANANATKKLREGRGCARPRGAVEAGDRVSDRNPLAALNPNAVFAKLCEIGEAYADADSAASMLEEVRKSVLARVALDHLEIHGGSYARAQDVALASEEYRRHVEAMVTARKVATRARVRWESAKVWADHARSQNANRRAELTMGGLAA